MDKLSSSTRINEALKKYDILNFKDVIFHLPRRYLNLTYNDEFKLNTNDSVTLYLMCSSAPQLFKGPKVKVINFSALSEGGVTYKLKAYNQLYIMSLLNVGTFFTVHGVINLNRREIIVNKVIGRKLNPEESLVPQYSLPSEVANFEFIKIVQKALKNFDEVSLVPSVFVDKNGLIPLNEAFLRVHSPRDMDDVFKGLETLKYEEGFKYFLSLLLIKKINSLLLNKKKTIVDLKDANAFTKSLPFKLTKEQLNAVREIGFDMNKETLMYRLLQGDVGSGKTVVAMNALYINYLRQAQGAFLAPTETLAKQHFDSLCAFFAPFPLRIVLLTGGVRESEKRVIKEDLKNGKIDLVVGTHALFSEDVVYKNLELVIIDELQKFGVNQRVTLQNKGEKADLLLLSATPIPQTLANVIYGDGSVTTIESFPFSARNVTTVVVNKHDKEIETSVKAALKSNEQVFVIAPLVNTSKRSNVSDLYKRYSAKYPGDVVMLHGQMKSEEKMAALNDFISKEKRILISTSIVEVGIDVKEASLMIIYDANNFGLSSLHQLRGRIGRDGREGKLFLVSEDEDNERLVTFSNENDGFKIAELDLSLRGPGELTGEKQSGMPSFRYLNIIKDRGLIKKIKDDAQFVLDNSQDQEFRKLLIKIKRETDL